MLDLIKVKIPDELDRQEQAYCLSLLDEKKHRRISVQTLFGNKVLKEALAKALDTPVQDIHFDFGVRNKPFLSGNPCFFNLSHSGKYVIAALSDSPVGVDIERIRPHSDRVVQHVLSERELEQFNGSADQDAFFTKLWTLKESYLKATGEGITRDLKSVMFSVDRKKISSNCKVKKLYTSEENGYMISACVL